MGQLPSSAGSGIATHSACDIIGRRRLPTARAEGGPAHHRCGRATGWDTLGRPCRPPAPRCAAAAVDAVRRADSAGPRPFRSDHLSVGPGMPLSDAQWMRIEPLLPDRAPKRRGRWRDRREVIDAIAWKFQTGSQWVHLPERFGNWPGVYNRLRMWAVDGTWERVFTALMAHADAEEDLNWIVSVDTTIVRAHQHAAGPAKRGSGRRAWRPCHRPLPRRSDHKDSPRRRRRLPPVGLRAHRRPGRRRTRLPGRHGQTARPTPAR
jgi:transposase